MEHINFQVTLLDFETNQELKLSIAGYRQLLERGSPLAELITKPGILSFHSTRDFSSYLNIDIREMEIILARFDPIAISGFPLELTFLAELRKKLGNTGQILIKDYVANKVLVVENALTASRLTKVVPASYIAGLIEDSKEQANVVLVAGYVFRDVKDITLSWPHYTAEQAKKSRTEYQNSLKKELTPF